MPSSAVVEFIRRCLAHESPSLRFQAVEWLLPLATSPAARELATDALVDEPDEGLQRLLRQFVEAG